MSTLFRAEAERLIFVIMNSQATRRILWGFVIGAVLIIFVISMLAFADNYAPEQAQRCTARFIESRWAAYLGCTMAKHEGLAAGLMGGAGALFGAWLAFDAVQEQILVEQNLRKKQEDEAKPLAVECIRDSVHAAAALLCRVTLALKPDIPQHNQCDEDVEISISRLKHSIENFIVREVLSNLKFSDRKQYLLIIEVCFGCANAGARKTPTSGRIRYLQNLRDNLMQLHQRLHDFDPGLASIFTHDSQPPPPPDIVNA
jgi:hypothetical protein